MLKNLRKITCILLALAMIFTVAACGKGDDSSEEVDVEYVYEYEYEDASKKEDGTDSSDGSNSGSSSTGSKGNSTSSSGSKKPANVSDDTLKKLRGTTVKYATWKDPALNEDGPVVEAFQKKYGIKVEVVPVAQATYCNTIQGLIASGNSPDVYFCTGDFPNNLACLQPISASKIDMKDDIWDQATFKMTTFKGEAYLCNTVGNIWNEVDCLYYNKSLWKQAGINSTPEEFDKAGKWNWDTLEQIMTSVSKLKNRVGGVIEIPPVVGSTGNAIFKLEKGKFVSGLNSNTMTEVMKKLASWKQAGITVGGGFDLFAAGNVGVYMSNAFGLKKTGWFADSNWDDIGFYYIPDFNDKTEATPTGIFRGWGLIRGAKNPEGAGLFMRYYLDVNNYDTTDAFISEDAESFFFKLTAGDQSKKTPYFTYCSFLDSISGVKSNALYAIAHTSAPDQVSVRLSTYKNSVADGAKKINQFVDKNTGVK